MESLTLSNKKFYSETFTLEHKWKCIIFFLKFLQSEFETSAKCGRNSPKYLEVVGNVQMYTTALMPCDPWESRLKLMLTLPDKNAYAQAKKLLK